MGREVRRVPADWRHPKYPDDYYDRHLRGRYIPLYGRSYAEEAAEWDEGRSQWIAGFCRSFGSGDKWEPREPKYAGFRYTEYAGERPSPDDYMPEWSDAERTHLMMYENTSEGTPISPAFATPEELAKWLADNGASAFAGETATYEHWLRVARGGYAPSAIFEGGKLMSGVEWLSS